MVHRLHSWSVTPKEAVRIQKELAGTVTSGPFRKKITSVAGTDISFDRRGNMLFAAVLVFSYPSLDMIERQFAVREADFPYVPGLLSFREIPALIDCFEKLNKAPDIILCDGQGKAHPRRFGLASHLGVLLERPAVGVAKSRLVGNGPEPGKIKGCVSPLMDKDEEIGKIIRTKDNVKPLFISIGHITDLQTAVKVVLQCCTRYRLPEPNRLAHIEVNRIRKQYLSGVIR
ncbi:deoxyribonuclease V [candidate division KSB1 bacterium]